MTDAEPRGGPRYTPYQQEFVRRFVAEVKPGSVHLLTGPVGTGKSFAMAGSISELAQARRVRRILVLAPAALTFQWVDQLESRGLDTVVIDGRMLRLLREQLGNTPDGWPEGVFSMSIDLAKRPTVREFVSAVAWDLVVVDEAHALSGQRLQLVEALVEKERPPSLLLATCVWSEGIRAFAERAALIDWTEAVSEFRSRQKEGTDAQLVRVTRVYRRSDEEVAVAAGVVETARELGQLRGMVLLQRAASGVSSLENTLVRWVEEPEENLEHVEAMDELLKRVEQLRVDTRLECFNGLLEELVGAGTRHVVTFCQYRATLDYLVAAVERLDIADFGLHGGMSGEQRRETMSLFEAEGGLLITTAAGMGLSLSFVEAVIHYDLPMSPVAFAQREGAYDRYGRSLPCTIYFFEDETGALPLEDLLVRMVRKQDLLTGEMDIDVSSVFRAVVK